MTSLTEEANRLRTALTKNTADGGRPVLDGFDQENLQAKWEEEILRREQAERDALLQVKCYLPVLSSEARNTWFVYSLR